MSWITWTTMLVVWPLVGLGLAYLFGRFTHGAEIWGNAGELRPPVVSYLRRVKRPKPQAQARTVAHTKRREAAAGRRTH